MKRLVTVALVAMFSVGVFAQQVSSISEISAFISTNDCRRCFKLTNDIDSVIAATTGILERSTCKLLKACILLDHSEYEACGDSFISATNLCNEIESDLAGLKAWQRIGALCIFSNAMIEDRHPEVAFAVSTNLLNEFQYTQCVDADTNVWNAVLKPGGLDIMPITCFIKANAAASQYRMDPSADISLYTNGLPQVVIREIIQK